jgi:hypothetical protein
MNESIYEYMFMTQIVTCFRRIFVIISFLPVLHLRQTSSSGSKIWPILDVALAPQHGSFLTVIQFLMHV